MDLGPGHVPVPHQLLNRADVVTRLQQMGGEAVARLWGIARLARKAGYVAYRPPESS
jgi:hypothetical protein